MKRCPNCNKIITGRTDKVFCDDKCRNNFYYKFNSEQKTFIRSVNKKLLKNRGIMRAINPSGRTSVPKHYLEEQGFDFSFFTGIHITKKGRPYYLVYDQAFSFDDDDRVSLVVFYNETQAVVG
ncbi:MAG: hypothetical protein J6W12_05965 [Bacteroidales bacterium]|nr:hypothetical protein [Bacteroidales bacterium]MCR5037477.1 DUF2116 family Zn-ribbon domain-containing protein [Bacteroidales bacterium]